MAVFRVERNRGYTVMSNHHLRNRGLTLKAKGLLSQMLSLPDNWDYTLAGLSHINREKIDAIREAVRELEKAGYIVRSRERDEKGRLRGADYPVILAATKGDPDAMKLVLQHYQSYIAHLSMQKIRDESGNTYWGIDEDLRERLQAKLMRAVLNFKAD